MPRRIRQPVVCVLGHIDSGKTTLLDKIRGTAVALREVGSMTQHIGASFFPLKTLKKICGPMLKKIGGRIKIPGLLVIDTPGHSVFVNLRRRGGSAADIAILVVDIIRGFEVQTYESLDILKRRKTPFIVAANKIDLLPGWVQHTNEPFLESFKNQDQSIQKQLEEHLYAIAGVLSRLGFEAKRFDQIKDFTKTVAIVPISAKTGEGIQELLSVLIGLTQQYMRGKLKVSRGAAKGTILEVKEEPGLGMTINTIIYDGVLREGDKIVVGGREDPIVTKVRAILLPKPLDEIRDPREKFTPVKEVYAAAGVKIAAPELEDVVAGAPMYAAISTQPIDDIIQAVSEDVEKLRIATDKNGVVVKTDTLGSLEALVGELENHGFLVRLADVGDVSRRDVTEASVVKREAPTLGAVLAFNVKVLPDAQDLAKNLIVPIFQNNVIYGLIEDYSEWVKRELKAREEKGLSALIRPGKIRFLPGFVFRKSKPAIFGVEVLGGVIQPGYPLIKSSGRAVGEIMQIQAKGETIHEATVGMEVAISVREAVIDRHVKENEILYVGVPEHDARELLTKYKDSLSPNEIQTLEELIQIMRKRSPIWGL